jgi:hypothetical protein
MKTNLSNKVKAQIKMDENKIKKRLGWASEDFDLLEMVESGMLEIQGEKGASELVYALTAEGVNYLAENENN